MLVSVFRVRTFLLTVLLHGGVGLNALGSLLLLLLRGEEVVLRVVRIVSLRFPVSLQVNQLHQPECSGWLQM